ncbi:hypothetical protein JZ785_19075 [Alicyclobacillus curvatus]|nr:hypothetical protein JZ785_19075 [Alicyclobacillus curvatus]
MTNSESKVPWPFKDEHKKGLRNNKKAKRPTIASEMSSQERNQGNQS